MKKGLTESPEKTQQHVKRREPQSDFAHSFQGGLHPIHQLQRTLGNRNVAKLIQAKRLTPEGKIIDLQRKLTVEAAHEPYEQEADRVEEYRKYKATFQASPPSGASQRPASAVMREPATNDAAAAAGPAAAGAAARPVQRHADKRRPEETEDRAPGGRGPSAPQNLVGLVGSLQSMLSNRQLARLVADGRVLARDANKMEGSFGIDFSAVRLHESSEAAKLGAVAFTRGTDIHFAPGEYDPSSERGQTLLGHELAHVVQQSEGRVAPTTQAKGVDVNDAAGLEREADDLGARAARGESVGAGGGAIADGSTPLTQLKATGGLVQLAAQTTHWGKFVDTSYTKTTRGADMTLTFEPGDNIDAKKIGLTQSVKTLASGSPIVVDPSTATRMVPSGPGAGYEHDRIAERNNPMYGSPSLGAGKGLKDTAETNAPSGSTPSVGTNATYELGHRFVKPDKSVDKKNASIWDKPERNAANDTSMIFETTALAIEGAQAGSYYGSVSWGWERDGSGTLKLLPFTKVSDGVPSQNFLAAAEMWNTSKTRGTLVAKNAPTQCYKFASGAFTADFTIAKGDKVTLNSTVGAGGVEYVSATVVDGAKAGSTTFIKATDMSDKGGGATLDLPVLDVHVINATGVKLNQDVPGPWRDTNPLPKGTRVVRTPTDTRTIDVPPEVGIPGSGGTITVMWVEVCDGSLIGKSGYVPTTALKDEK